MPDGNSICVATHHGNLCFAALPLVSQQLRLQVSANNVQILRVHHVWSPDKSNRTKKHITDDNNI